MANNKFEIRFHQPLRDAGLVAAASTPVRADRAATHDIPAPPANQAQSSGSIEKLLTEMFSDLNHQLDELESRRQQSMSELHQVAVEIALAVAGKLTYSQIQTDQFPIDEMVGQMVSQIQSSEPLIVYLNPQDLELLKTKLAASQPKWNSDDRVQFVAEPGFARGHCEIEAAKYCLFYDTAVQIGEIRQAIRESLHEAEIERRQTGQQNSGLRRFPNRRAVG